MKMKTAILSILACVAVAGFAHASECDGPDCMPDDFYSASVAQWNAPVWQETEITTVDAMPYAPRPIYMTRPVEQMYPARLLTVKPVPADSRAPLWDGTIEPYQARAFDKTVDWRDGVPIWDDSISHYRDKDYHDWFLEPRPEIYLEEYVTTDTGGDVMAMYAETMRDAAETRARVEELLAPARPSGNLWGDNVNVTCDAAPTITTVVETCDTQKYAAQDLTAAVSAAFGAQNDGCPFDTAAECEIWRRKPVMRESVSPRSPKIRQDKVDEFISAFRCDANITANDASAAPLLARYKMLMRSAAACCTDGMAYALRQAGASDGLVYKFLADDANFYGLGSRCLMMSDADLDAKYPNTATAAVAADVRNGCLCRGRQWFDAMLSPFRQVYASVPEFASMPFLYTYRDGLNREIQVSVNNDVRNVLNQLAQCP